MPAMTSTPPQIQSAYGDFYQLNAIKLIQAMVMFGLEAFHP